MRKFYTLLSAALLTTAAVNAQQLGQANVTNPEGGPYMTSFITYVELEWQNDMGIVEVAFAPNASTVSLILNGEKYEVLPDLIFKNDNVPDPMNTRDEESGIGISIDFYEQYEKAGYPDTGTIEIIIPEGLVVDAEGNSNAAQTLNYDIMAQYPDSDIVINPAPYKTYPPSYLSDVTVTFDEKLTVLQENPAIQILKQTDDFQYENLDYVGGIEVAENSFSLNLSSLLEGEYNIIIPEGYVKVGEDAINGPIYIAYTIFEGLPSAEVLQGPGSIAAAGYLTPLMLTWDYNTISATAEGLSASISGNDSEYNEVSIEIPASAFSFATIDKPGDDPGTPDTGSRAEESGNVLIIDYAELLSDLTGDFKIEIPEGIVVDADGYLNPLEDISFSLYNYADVEADIEIDNEGIFTVQWPGYSVSSIQEDAPWFITNSKGERTYLSESQWWAPGGQIEVNYEDGNYSIDLSNLDLADGAYSLTIPEYSVILQNDEYKSFLAHEQYYNFSIQDGLADVKVIKVESLNAGVKGVYNLQGVKVADDLNSALPSGLYIINGKKVMLRK